MTVGNDLVDLADPQSQPDAIHPRWDERVFTPEERETLFQDGDPHTLRWLLWAAKESAFKAAKKLDASVWFQPRAFVTQRLCDDQIRVTWTPKDRPAPHQRSVGPCEPCPSAMFRVWFDTAQDWVHAMATPWTQAEKPEGMVSAVEPSEPTPPSHHPLWRVPDFSWPVGDPSAAVRALAQTAVARLLTLGEPLVEIVTSSGIPTAIFKGRRLPVDLSLSHHGRFIACGVSNRAHQNP